MANSKTWEGGGCFSTEFEIMKPKQKGIEREMDLYQVATLRGWFKQNFINVSSKHWTKIRPED